MQKYKINTHIQTDRVILSSMAGDVRDAELVSVFRTPKKKKKELDDIIRILDLP